MDGARGRCPEGGGDAALEGRLGGGRVEWEAEIVAMDDDELLEWHARGNGPHDTRFELASEGENVTRVTVHDRLRPEGALEGAGTAVRLGKCRLQKDLENLKRRLESLE